jgi:hypothetical protein
MRTLRLIFILGFILFPALANADCSAVKWKRPGDIKSLKVRDFLSMDRKQLYANLYFELSHPKTDRTPGLGTALFHFLINTEKNEAKYHLLQAFESTAALDKPDAQVIPLQELCTLDKRADAFKGIPEDSQAGEEPVNTKVHVMPLDPDLDVKVLTGNHQEIIVDSPSTPASGSKTSLPSREDRERLFKKVGITKYIGSFDELDRDVLFKRARSSSPAELRKTYPSIPLEALQGLVRVIQ